MASRTKVIVVGLDGLEPSIVEAMLEAGTLPNLAALRDRGGFGRVATTAPAQTPVAWASFSTGTNPGGHGVFDFLRRDPQSYRPDLALNRYEQKSAFLPPRVVNLRRGVPVWSVLSQAGRPASVIRCPCTYPPDPVKGRLLSGMGVPDLRGGFGTSTFYTTASGVEPRESEQVVHLPTSGPDPIETYLIGPRNPKDRTDVRFAMTLVPRSDGQGLFIRSAGSPNELEVRPGQWSDWLRVKFKLGMLQSVRGIVRFLLVKTGSTLELYASPVNFDPESPPYPISAPDDFAWELSRVIGPYYTAGMVEDHTGLNNERFDEAAYLAQCDIAWRDREAMFRRELDLLDDGLLYCLFDTPDRIQHMFWRFREPGHPANRGRSFSPEFTDTIEATYRRADAMVGHALEAADDQTLVIALSDHGFSSFRRCVDLNAWLFDRGLLALEPGNRPGDDPGGPLQGIDWSKTRAYAFGLTGIYLNLQGREGQGIVAPDEAGALRESIARELTGLRDPEGGAVAVRGVDPRDRIYSGPFVEEAPDLFVRHAPGYRVSWGSALGHVAGSTFEDNTRKWAGDHIIDPAAVPGVLFMNRAFRGDGASLVDLAPTILDALGVPPGPAMEGRSLIR